MFFFVTQLLGATLIFMIAGHHPILLSGWVHDLPRLGEGDPELVGPINARPVEVLEHLQQTKWSAQNCCRFAPTYTTDAQTLGVRMSSVDMDCVCASQRKTIREYCGENRAPPTPPT